jgi:hypothetical protein
MDPNVDRHTALTGLDSRNQTVVRQLVEAVLGRGEVNLLPILVSPDYIGHLPIGDHYGPEGVRIDFAAYHAALPDLTVTVEDIFDLDDRVVRRYTIRGTHLGAWLGHAPTGKPVELRVIAIDKLEAGMLVESWITTSGL